IKSEFLGSGIVVWGALDHDLNLDIPGFPRSDIVADIKWNRNKNKIARIKKDMPLHNETDKYDMFTNGTLKIKTLMRNDSGLYEVEVYDSNGVNLLSKKFDLKIQDEGLDWYLIIGICVGGAVFLLFVALLIFYISRRKKQSRRRDDEELEIKAQRAILEERGRKPQQTPVSTPANPGMSQTPPVPGHRSQPPAHRPRALGPRVQPQQKRLPPTPGTQVHQQKGPPLPKPRVQTKPPCDAEENS
uniref:Immunoglobulin V-set domain-containing protein n=1 Tax=Bos mutus grunniens TaxID=30521 RepID=A0A8B9WXT7_BOSMU